jgi:hypothetical protein
MSALRISSIITRGSSDSTSCGDTQYERRYKQVQRSRLDMDARDQERQINTLQRRLSRCIGTESDRAQLALLQSQRRSQTRYENELELESSHVRSSPQDVQPSSPQDVESEDPLVIIDEMRKADIVAEFKQHLQLRYT